MEGIIKSGIGGLYEVFLQDKTILPCRAAGKIRLTGEKPLPGDRVMIQENGEEGYITEILPRKNMLIRPACANIDNLVIAFSPRSPKPDTFFIDTLTVQCEAAGITPILCITKSDLDKNGQLDYLKSIYEKTGYTMIVTSAKTENGYEKDIDRSCVGSDGAAYLMQQLGASAGTRSIRSVRRRVGADILYSDS